MLLSALAASSLVVSGIAIVGAAGPAAAAVTSACAWTGSGADANWSTAGNWGNVSGAAVTCTTDTGGPVAGSAIVFPSGPTVTTVSYNSTANTAYDSITFQAAYTVNDNSGGHSVTLTPTTATPCGSATTVGLCDTSGTGTFSPPIVLGASQEFAASSGVSLHVFGVVSGGHALTANDGSHTGLVELNQANTYTGGTTVAAGGLIVGNSSALGTGAVTVDHSGWLYLSTSENVANTLVLGDGTAGTAYLMGQGGSPQWSGTIELNATTHAYIASQAPGDFLLVSGDIVDQTTMPSTRLELNGVSAGGFVELSGTGNTYDNGTTLDAGYIQVDAGTTLGTGPVANLNATLTGAGIIPGVSSNGQVFPAWYTHETSALLTSTGSVDLAAGGGPGSFIAYMTGNGTTPGTDYSQLRVTGGTVTPHGADLQLGGNFTPGQSYTIVQTTGSSSVASNSFFRDPCNGATLTNGSTFVPECHTGTTMTITYTSSAIIVRDVSGTGGGGFTPPPPCPSGTTGCNSGSSGSSTGSATVTNGGVTATATGGPGTVTVGPYGSDPEGPPNFPATGQYFDVSLSAGNGFTSVTINDCNAMGGTTLEWWNPAANGGAGAWQQVVGNPGPTSTPGPPPCVTVTLDSTTSPSLADLTGTVFAASTGPASPSAATAGYWVAGSDGGIYAFGNAPFEGSLPGDGVHVNNVVGIAPTADRGGYWLVGSDGGIFAFGDAGYRGSLPGLGIHVNNIVGIAPTPDGGGYWLVGSDGGVFAFGDAGFHGSMGGKKLNAPVVGIAPTADGSGYWLAAADGGVFAFNAPFRGSMGGTKLNKPVVGMADDPATSGYWLVASDGGIFSFGAPFYGSTGSLKLNQPVVGMAPVTDGSGYWLVAADGGIFAFNAPFEGSVPGANVHVTNVKGMAGT